jgi:hypothetical protein
VKRVLLALLLLLTPTSTAADSDLTQAVNAAFIPRAEDPALHELAHQRAYEASLNFAHTGCCAEVLAYNSGFPDPVGTVISQWLGSPAHDSLLSDPSFDLIGCGSVTVNGTYDAACLLSRGPAAIVPPAEVPYSPPATAPAPHVGTEPALLPNTAMRTTDGLSD